MKDVAEIIAANVTRLRERIDQAARRSGRKGDRIGLVAVTKYVDIDVARALTEAGCVDLGESRPQELWRKADSLPGDSIRWHMIGHLQRNKVRRTLPYVSLLHSADRLRLLDEVSRISKELSRMSSVLLEVNVSGDAAKHGFVPDEMVDVLAHVATLDHVRVRGLMAMAGWEGDLDAARADFSRLRQLRDTLRTHCPPQVSLDELSMGMSGDFEVAIEEGATLVRVGSALCEGLPQ
ncbi:MAG: YggS family pyridoxal phosphate-dependent enzyme [Pirellulaceae bacterium]